MDITIKVSDLKKMVEELLKENMEYVDIYIGEPFDLGDGEMYPKHMHFDAYDGYGGGIDFENIEHVEISPFYKFK